MVTPQEILRLVETRHDELVTLRREFHAYPELSFQEQRTAGRIAELLAQAGLEVRTGVGRTGVSALLRGARPGKRLLVRADIDALPIEERTGAPYQSRHPGVMHACGHDGHAAVGVITAQLLASLRDQLSGEVQFVFQPAEETIGGAKAMLEDGVLAERQPDACLALHIWNLLPAGTVGVREGPLFAATDQFTIRVLGRGGHGAMPHQCIDPIPVAAQIILALQTIVSREVSPFESAVVTVGTMNAGSAFNIIAPEAVLHGTVRTFDRQLQLRIKERMETLVQAIATAGRATAEFDYQMPCPAVVNDPQVTAFVRGVATQVLGERQVLVADPTMGGDDMSFFLQRIPGCYFLVGGANPSGQTAGHHNPEFDFDERCLGVGTAVLCASALKYLA